MRTYGQYCPIARGPEIFAERWTPLIVRNLSLGCGHFGEILAGAPGLSRTLLSQRLGEWGARWLEIAPENLDPFVARNARSMFAHIKPVSPSAAS